uniref:Uncharacterized protein n=1 Tax=Arundo donax TaxID=35708 RepID=A0A0A9FBU2_ARUDO
MSFATMSITTGLSKISNVSMDYVGPSKLSKMTGTKAQGQLIQLPAWRLESVKLKLESGKNG